VVYQPAFVVELGDRMDENGVVGRLTVYSPRGLKRSTPLMAGQFIALLDVLADSTKAVLGTEPFNLWTGDQEVA
jgi:hypothetical protein